MKILAKVIFCVCMSIIAAAQTIAKTPFTPGHEMVGEVSWSGLGYFVVMLLLINN